MRIYRIYGVYSSNHFFSISYAAYVKLLSCEGLPSAKNCMGTLPLDSPKLNKDGSITLWNRCMMQKKNILESSRNGFIVEITRTIFPPIWGKTNFQETFSETMVQRVSSLHRVVLPGAPEFVKSPEGSRRNCWNPETKNTAIDSIDHQNTVSPGCMVKKKQKIPSS